MSAIISLKSNSKVNQDPIFLYIIDEDIQVYLQPLCY